MFVQALGVPTIRQRESAHVITNRTLRLQSFGTTRLFVSFALSMALVLATFSASPAAASTVWESVNVSSAPFVDTLADGTVVTVTFGTAAGYYGATFAPAFYKTDATGPVTTSWVRFSFSRPVTSLRTYYAYLGVGDDERFTTDLGDVDLSRTFASGGNLVSSTGGFIGGQPEGTYSSDGTVSSPSGDRSATLQLQFSTGITWLEVRGAPPSPLPAGGQAGINLTGLQLEVVATTITFDPNGGSGTMASQTSSGTAALTPNTFARSGFSFAGWNTSADGLGTPYSDAGSFDFSLADDTLFAQWTADSATPVAESSPPAVAPPDELATTGTSFGSMPLASGLLLAIGAGLIVARNRRRATGLLG